MPLVLLFGTFDILHSGHAFLFKQARQVAAAISRVPMSIKAKQSRPQIIAIVARDATVKKVKKHSPINSEKTRVENLQKTGWANKVILGRVGDKYSIIKQIKPDVICLGYDQKFFARGLRQKLRQFKFNTKIIRLKSFYPKRFKSSIIYVRHQIHPRKSQTH